MSNLVKQYKIQNTRFVANCKIDGETITRCSDFALEMTCGSGYTNPKASGGTFKRSREVILKNQFTGKLAECAFYNFIKDSNSNICITEPNFFIGGHGISDQYDFLITTSKQLVLNVSIKSGASYSNFLLLEADRYDKDLRFVDIDASQSPKLVNLFIFCRVKIPKVPNLRKALTTKSIMNENILCEIAGFLPRKVALKKMKEPGRLLPKGNSNIDPRGLKVSNWFYHTSELMCDWSLME